MFFPSPIGLLINPFYFARKELAAQIREQALSVQGKTLDVGCGSKPYQTLCHSSEYIGMELDTEENRKKKLADCFYDGHRFPFEAETFDSAVASQVLEHVFNPEEFLGELCRVLKSGGLVLMTVPFIWDEHEQPADYARYSSFGLQSLLEANGFDVIVHTKTLTDIRVLFQLFNCYIHKTLMVRSRFLYALLTLLVVAPCNCLGSILGWVTPVDPDLYLDNVVLARKRDFLSCAPRKFPDSEQRSGRL
jgi:SAM-dependent methyltransferase